MKTWYLGRDPLVRIIIAAFVAFLVLVILALWFLPAVEAAPASTHTPPPSIRTTATLRNVYCAMGCCCGTLSATYQGHYYDAGPLGYCRWFTPLRNGQRVTATLTLTR